MGRFKSSWMPVALAGIALGSTPLLARADFQLRITRVGGPVLLVADNSPFDTNPAIDQITTGAAVFGPAGVFTDFTGSLSGSVTQTGLISTLSTTTNLQRADTTGSGQLVVETTRDLYNLPAGPNLFLTGSTAGIFTSVPSGLGNYSFQGWVDINDVLYGMGPITTGMQGPFDSTSLGPNAFSADTPGVFFTRLGTPYSLTGRSSFDLGGALGGDILASSSATVALPSGVAAVPAPPSVLMLASGGFAGLLWHVRRRAGKFLNGSAVG